MMYSKKLIIIIIYNYLFYNRIDIFDFHKF